MFVFNKIYDTSSAFSSELSVLDERVSWTASHHHLEQYIAQSILLGWHTHRELDILSDRDVNYWLFDPHNLSPEPTEERLMAVYLRHERELLAVQPRYEVRKISPEAVYAERFPGSRDDYQLLDGYMTGCVRCFQFRCYDTRKCFPEAFSSVGDSNFHDLLEPPEGMNSW